MSFFFFNDTATTEIYTLSLHDALPISQQDLIIFIQPIEGDPRLQVFIVPRGTAGHRADRKSTRLNSSHLVISYAVFCLKKKNAAPSDHAAPYSTGRTLWTNTTAQRPSR